MKMLSDHEIARQANPKPIAEVARELGIDPKYLISFGDEINKVHLDALTESRKRPDAPKLVLVSATTPTAAGEGKTTTSIGLANGLKHIGQSVACALREPSLGPCFGIKGGATGGGYAQMIPADRINLHFTGDFHALTTTNNLISAMVDNHIFHGNKLGIDPRTIAWRRVMDMNDRSLRKIVLGLGGRMQGIPREGGFDITAASEIMAILCLSNSMEDLHRRLEQIFLGFTYDGEPVYAKSLEVTGALMALLRDAVHPNLVQTLEGVPVFVHGGKDKNDLQSPDPEAVRGGLENLDKHIESVRNFNKYPVVALNRFISDTDEEVAIVAERAARHGVAYAESRHFMEGGPGSADLAREVMAAVGKSGKLQPLYDLDMTVPEKVRAVSQKMYGADDIAFSKEAEKDLRMVQKLGLENLPVCIAKAPSSLSDDPVLVGRPRDFQITVRNIQISAGAEFLVVLTGDILRMPGLPKKPQALKVRLNPDGTVDGVS
jgi:formyltetrahydrofolate synthetase